MKQCPTCQQEKPIEEFIFSLSKDGPVKERECCLLCRKQNRNNYERELRLKNKDERKEYMSAYREKNKEKMNEYQRKWGKENKAKRTAYCLKHRNSSPENKAKHATICKKYQAKIRKQKGPQHLLIKMRRHFRRICNGIRAQKSFSYIGVESVEDFLAKMTAKTDNPNWIKDGYEIDHIWQINWLDLNGIEDAESLYELIHHHSNVRPLDPSKNASRSFFDFTPCDKADFEKFKPFLKQEIILAMTYFWENPDLFSREMILKISKEDDILKDISLGFL